MDGMPPQDQNWADLLGPDRDPSGAVEEIRHQLGIGARRVRYGDGLPDVSGLAEELGLGRPE